MAAPGSRGAQRALHQRRSDAAAAAARVHREPDPSGERAADSQVQAVACQSRTVPTMLPVLDRDQATGRSAGRRPSRSRSEVFVERRPVRRQGVEQRLALCGVGFSFLADHDHAAVLLASRPSPARGEGSGTSSPSLGDVGVVGLQQQEAVEGDRRGQVAVLRRQLPSMSSLSQISRLTGPRIRAALRAHVPPSRRSVRASARGASSSPSRGVRIG